MTNNRLYDIEVLTRAGEWRFVAGPYSQTSGYGALRYFWKDNYPKTPAALTADLLVLEPNRAQFRAKAHNHRECWCGIDHTLGAGVKELAAQRER